MSSDDTSVTICTEKPTNESRVMVMVNGEPCFKVNSRASTNSTASVLFLQECFILFLGYSIKFLEPVSPGQKGSPGAVGGDTRRPAWSTSMTLGSLTTLVRCLGPVE